MGKGHAKNEDIYLNKDGANEVSATQLKQAVTDDHTHTNKSTLDSTQESFTTSLKTKLDNIVNPMLFKGNISVASDFPTLLLVENGWTYNVTTDVTDNDVTKTNTELSFSAKTEIAWNGSTWIELGYSDVKSVNNKTGIVNLVATDVGAIKAAIDTYTEKVTPANEDSIAIEDSEVSGTPIKKTLWSDIKTTLKTYFDTIYTLTNLGGVSTSRQVNGHALSADVTVSKSDVGLSAVANVDTTIGAIDIFIDGGGATITAGKKVWVEIPFACTLNRYTLIGDVAGTIVIDVNRSTYANFPTTVSMSGSGKEPTITATNQKSQDVDISDWTSVAVVAGDVLEFEVKSCSTITKATLSLKYIRT